MGYTIRETVVSWGVTKVYPQRASWNGETYDLGGKQPDRFKRVEDVIAAANSRAYDDHTPQYWERLACQEFMGWSLPPQDAATIELIQANRERRAAYLQAQAKAAEYQRKKRKADARQHGKEVRPYRKRRR